MKEIRLQYISQGKTPEEHLENITAVCKAGGRWIQLRLKDVDMATYVNTATKCRNICDIYNAIMIVNDAVSVAKTSLADGVHLGLNDMSIKDARKILGKNAIIGGTANTINDCLEHINAEVDYIGLGPFRYTLTKDKLSPVLGVKGYEQILSELKKKEKATPIIAIGGIIEDDIKPLMRTGVSGIAVSGLLTNITELSEKITQITKNMGQSFIINSQEL